MDMGRTTTLAVLAGALIAGSAGAAEPAAKCEAAKLKATGLYAACRLKAESKARLRGAAPDYAKCAATFAKQFDKAEDKAGPGICPSGGDRAVIDAVVAAETAGLAHLLGGPGACPHADQDRTPSAVVSDLRAAAAAEDWVAFGCAYHADAFMIDDQGVLVGRAEIVSAYQSLHQLAGGAAPVVTEETPFRDVVRTLFTLDAGWWEIPDGVHTYVVEAGRIRRQTTHGVIVFTGPPPDDP